jgi:S-formylglutathione hydrolase
MESYLTHELLPLLAQHLPIDLERVGIFGHSMGGHGALTLALRHPGRSKACRRWRRFPRPRNAPGAARPSPATWAMTQPNGANTTPVC